MASKDSSFTLHPALGGLDVSSDPTVLDANYVTVADNIEYLEAGQRAKRGGLNPFTATTSARGDATPHPVLSTSAPIKAMKDCWLNSSNQFLQRYVVAAGASLFATATSSVASTQAGPPNGYWTAFTTTSSFGSATNMTTNITLANNYAVVSDGLTAPVALNFATSALQTATSGSAWPVFEHSVYHLRRLWMGGLSTAPGEIVYSGAGNIFDSTGTDTAILPINEGDGDRVIGMSKPLLGNIYIFKGPNKGSVWSIGGLTPTFTLTPVATGNPALNHAAIVTTPTDIYWISRHGVHSLQATIKFGNVDQAFLSLPLKRWWRNNIINTNDLINAKGFHDPYHNIVGWSITPGGTSGTGTRTWLIIYNYALSDPAPGGKKWWSVWKLSNSIGITALDVMINSSSWTQQAAQSNSYHLYVGGDDGVLYEAEDPVQDDNGVAYTATVTTPILSKFDTPMGSLFETDEKQFAGVTTYYSVRTTSGTNVTNAQMTITVDGRTQNASISLSGGGATLG